MYRILLLLPLAAALRAQTPGPPLTPAETAKLESSVESNPDDVDARSRLVAAYWRAGATSPDSVKPLRRKHILYLIEHQPATAVLGEAAGTIDPAGHALADPEGYRLAEAAWKQRLAAGTPAPAVYANALNFFKTPDPPYARRLAAEALERYPDSPGIADRKGALDALAILGAKLLDNYGSVSAFDPSPDPAVAAEARRELETTTNSHILGGAGSVLQRQQFALSRARRESQIPEIMALAERCFQRAIEIEPRNSGWSSGLRLVYTAQASFARSADERLKYFEKAVSIPGGERDRWYPMTDLAEAQFAAGALDKAAATAREVLEIAPRYPTDWNYGNAIHKSNIVLGRIALKRGDAVEAGKLLVAAGKTPGSPQLNSFGPDWTLAQELLAKDQSAAVLEYIALCRKFWTSGGPRLDDWGSAIKAGSSPDFRAPAGVRTPMLIGKAAPDFSLTDILGRKLSLADYKGKAILLDFWATWCPPCRAEMPDFEKLHRELDGKDAAILTIDVNEPQEVIAEYMAKEKFTFPVLLANNTGTMTKYGVNAYPTLVAVDPAGKVAAYAVGKQSTEALRDALAKARGGAPAPTNAALAAPRLLSPAPASVFDHYPRQTTLVWAAVPGAAAYVVETEFFADGKWQGHFEKRVTDPVYDFKFVGAQPGRWRVFAVDAAGREGPKSDWREFRYTH